MCHFLPFFLWTMCACPLIGGSSHSHEPSNQRNSSLQRGRLEWVLMSLTQLCRRFVKRLMGTRTNNQIQLDFFATVPSVSVYRILTFLRLVVVLSNTINTSLILAVFGQMLNNDPSTERCWPALSYVESHTSQNLWAFWVCFTCLTLPKLAVECTDSCSGFCEPPYSDGQCLGPLESLVLPGMYTDQRPPCPRTDDPVAVW